MIKGSLSPGYAVGYARFDAGGAGFIGSNLSRYLLESVPGVRVRVLDDLSTGRLSNLDGVDVQFIEGSILDYPTLLAAMEGVDSLVHLGATEEECVPVLEQASGLKFNEDFFVGYSPERINPGDKERRVTNITKVTAGSTPEAAELMDEVYQKVIRVGTHKAPTIKVAEAAKVIENTQRDVNIALMNELAILFDRLGIDTSDVLAAAGTKWNFWPFTPGLVGGHCIGVDPYYLTHKAQAVGHHPEIILAGRRLNDSMGAYVASQMVKQMVKNDAHIHGAHVLVLGLSFKENTPDLRNTRVIDVVRELEDYGIEVDVYDPWASPQEAQAEYGTTLIDTPTSNDGYDGIILAVPHENILELADNLAAPRENGTRPVVFDLKSALPEGMADARL